ncbi:glutathione S-transferase family protein [Otariodibacter sp.]|uniref:glutathione S-transferase family protein n=1 Tax=Otariodibacter sp. TaxID=3030919 RepID=UPI00260FE9BF|nr:glutathione S-transferase family protein [Otariodibacter sp.]
MGIVIDGKWHDTKVNPAIVNGRYERAITQFRNWITADGEAGPTGVGGFKAEPNRYHLYVSLACPWAHRTLIYRKLKGLENMISVSVVNPFMGEYGWTFEEGEGVIPDPILNVKYIHQVYIAANANYTGRASVPVLWDKKTHTIVSNESSEIIRMFNSAFDGIGANPVNFLPADLVQEIDELNEFIYPNINNGVYRSGFATIQEGYEEAVTGVFSALDKLEERLSTRRYLTGNQITEADWRLFTTLVRFDPVYFGHFKCNVRRIVDYPNLWGYLRDLYQVPGIAETVNMKHIKEHYYRSHTAVNPTGIVPIGPDIDFTTPHGREKLSA